MEKKIDAPHDDSHLQRALSPPFCVRCDHLSCRPDDAPLRCDALDGGCLGIICCLAGNVHMQISDNGTIAQHSIPAGRLGCYACSRGQCLTRCLSTQCARILNLRFSTASLQALMGGSTVSGRHLVPGAESQFVGMVRDITPPMIPVIDSIQEALRRRPTAELLLLAKTLELLYLHLSVPPQAHAPTINTRDHEAILKARHLLIHCLEAPPSLSELATAVGMSVSKLKLLFPKICGMPPYEYLRKMRMQRAKALLCQEGMNVTEAAMAVGYNSISHFSKAFHREYAVHPSQVRRLAGN